MVSGHKEPIKQKYISTPLIYLQTLVNINILQAPGVPGHGNGDNDEIKCHIFEEKIGKIIAKLFTVDKLI